MKKAIFISQRLAHVKHCDNGQLIQRFNVFFCVLRVSTLRSINLTCKKIVSYLDLTLGTYISQNINELRSTDENTWILHDSYKLPRSRGIFRYNRRDTVVGEEIHGGYFLVYIICQSTQTLSC